MTRIKRLPDTFLVGIYTGNNFFYPCFIRPILPIRACSIFSGFPKKERCCNECSKYEKAN